MKELFWRKIKLITGFILVYFRQIKPARPEWIVGGRPPEAGLRRGEGALHRGGVLGVGASVAEVQPLLHEARDAARAGVAHHGDDVLRRAPLRVQDVGGVRRPAPVLLRGARVVDRQQLGVEQVLF